MGMLLRFLFAYAAPIGNAVNMFGRFPLTADIAPVVFPGEVYPAVLVARTA